ncbi:MAG: ABC transporter substrate-binding protein [Rhodocyclaceae bacterium]|nr:ABC transporter substrate-binding protein [Rhodocyclaceae bacterium]MBK6675993.1 ABC transporter substrate-binding protein [Rhodocyclaceae bacterium]MBK9311384.1 ABC transporter substrate-binding protein [Rhodocyclaceae bacterium]MBK9956461.1 ABC transporter substrate-binding protein [Rhodocyclaceae bacterium]
MRRAIIKTGLLGAFALGAIAAHAEITIGLSLGTTGPGASMGIPYKNALQLVPKTLGGEPVRYIVLDDESKPDNAAKNALKFVADYKIDALMGSNNVPASLAMTQVAAEAKVPLIALAPLPQLAAEKHKWTFVVPQPPDLMMSAVAQHMKSRGIKTAGYIGYSDTWGDLVYNAISALSEANGFKVVTNERFGRADASVAGQVMKIIAADPDAVVVGGSGSPAATPQIALVERGFKKPIYHNPGTVNLAFIQTGKSAAEGAIAPTGPLIVAEDLPDNFPTKTVSLDFVKRYETMFGAGSRNGFAGYTYDGVLLLDAAVTVALKKAKPGTPEFRVALRDAIESVNNLIGTHGVYNMTPANHNGQDERSRVLVHVMKGEWRLVK